MKYIYISKESAKKGTSLIYEVSDKKIENFENYFSERGILDSVNIMDIICLVLLHI